MPPKKKTKTAAEENPQVEANQSVTASKPAQPPPAEEKKEVPPKPEVKKPSAPVPTSAQSSQQPAQQPAASGKVEEKANDEDKEKGAKKIDLEQAEKMKEEERL